MLKRLLSAAAAVALTAAAFAVPARAADISASSAIVVEAESGTVLFEKDADARMRIASTTKIMTALVALEHCSLDERVQIPAVCETVEGSSMYLKAGEIYTMRELLYGLMLESGNDAAVAVALHVSGSTEAFAELMNRRAASLGCTGTHFENPNGLDAPEHYSTARDMARIAAEAMKNQLFEEIVSTKTISFGGKTYVNHNRLLWTCPGAIGLKTGYTMASGRTLVSCAERDGMRLICVTLRDPDDWDDHRALYDEAFSEWKMAASPGAGVTAAELPVVSGTAKTVAVAPASSARLLVRRGADVRTELRLPDFVYAEVTKGEKAGSLSVLADGKEIFSADLVYVSTVKQNRSDRLTLRERLRRALGAAG